MNYKIKLNKSETHGVYVLERMVNRCTFRKAQVELSTTDLAAAYLVVKRLMEAVEEGMVVKLKDP